MATLTVAAVKINNRLWNSPTHPAVWAIINLLIEFGIFQLLIIINIQNLLSDNNQN